MGNVAGQAKELWAGTIPGERPPHSIWQEGLPEEQGKGKKDKHIRFSLVYALPDPKPPSWSKAGLQDDW